MADTEIIINETDENYQWFQYADKHPFQYNTKEYSSINAVWLIDCARLSYIKNTKYVEEQLLTAGFSEVKFFDRKGTQAFVAVSEFTIIVAFRGTQMDEFKDIKTDLNILLVDNKDGGHVHKGFLQGLNAVWRDMEPYILSFKNRKIWWCGHSLGGALATIAAGKLSGQGLYTFGSPRVGNKKFAKMVISKINHCRFVHANDIVPRFPLPIFYRHTNNMIYISYNGKVYHNAMWWSPWIDNTKIQCKKIICKLVGRTDLFDGFYDHSIFVYIEKIKKYYFSNIA